MASGRLRRDGPTVNNERRDELEQEIVDLFQVEFPLTVTDPGPVAAALIEGGWRFVGDVDTCCPETDVVRRMREHLAEVSAVYRIVRTDRVSPVMIEAAVPLLEQAASALRTTPPAELPRVASAALRRILEAALKASPT